MGNFSSCSSIYSNIDIRDVVIRDDIKNWVDASAFSLEKDKYKEGSVSSANHLIGYENVIAFKIANYTRFESGLYLYTSGSKTVVSLFGPRYTADLLNNIRVKNKNVQMFISIASLTGDNTEIINMYDPEFLELKYHYACTFNTMSFLFLTETPILDEFEITCTKYVAGPMKFRRHLAEQYNVDPIHITCGPKKSKTSRILFNEFVESIHKWTPGKDTSAVPEPVI